MRGKMPFFYPISVQFFLKKFGCPSYLLVLLASRLFKAAGGAAVYSKNPYGRFLADINVGRQHAANQFAMFGANWSKVQLGLPNQDYFL